jgi:hypothetical protein
MRWTSLLVAGVGMLALASLSQPAALAGERDAAASVAEFSAQSQPRARRPRITVRPAERERDLSNYRRECEPVFEERWIPQWGGRVLYASQRCRWVRM